MTFSLCIIACHRCPNVDWSIEGRPPCKISGRYFVDHAQAGDCPINRFTEENTKRIPAAESKHWGPPRWERIHSATTAAEVRRELIALPCGECKAETAKYLKEFPIPEDRHELRRWGWWFHERINQRLGKQIFTWPEFEEKYPRPTGLIHRPLDRR